MSFFKRTEKIKRIRAILKERDIEITEPDFVMSVSQGRANMIKLLSVDELNKLINNLTECGFHFLLNGIYTVAFELGVIKNKNPNFYNDELIREYMKSEINFDIPIRQQSYKQLYFIAEKLGEMFISKSSALN